MKSLSVTSQMKLLGYRAIWRCMCNTLCNVLRVVSVDTVLKYEHYGGSCRAVRIEIVH